MPTDVFLLVHCMADSLRSCLMPEGFSAISGSLAGGILGFGAAAWIVLLDTSHDLATVLVLLFLLFL